MTNITISDLLREIDSPEDIQFEKLSIQLMNSDLSDGIPWEYLVKLLDRCGLRYYKSVSRNKSDYKLSIEKSIETVIGKAIFLYFNDNHKINDEELNYIILNKYSNLFLKYFCRRDIEIIYNRFIKNYIKPCIAGKNKKDGTIHDLIEFFTIVSNARLNAGAPVSVFEEIIKIFGVLNPLFVDYAFDDGKDELCGKYSDFLTEAWDIWHSLPFGDKNPRTMLELASLYSGISYKLFDDYFICYKGVKKNGASCYLKSIIYKPGQTYSSACDDNIYNDVSYGISAWDFKSAHHFSDEKVLELQVFYDNLMYVDMCTAKIRASEVNILNEIKLSDYEKE